MNMRKSTTIIAALAIAVLGGTGMTLALASSHRTHAKPSKRHRRTLHAKAPVRTIDSRIVKHLRLFRAARAAGAPELPAAARQSFSSTLGKYAGANLALARGVDTPQGPLYVIPADDEICQISGGGWGCGSIDKLGKDPRAYVLFGRTTAYPPHTQVAAGIVADDVTSIDAILADGSAKDVPLSENVYSILLPDSATKLVFHTTDRGTVTSAIPPPPGPAAP